MEQSQQNTPHTKSQSQWMAISALTGLLIAMLACLLMVYGSSDQGKTENEAPANPDINRYEIIQLNPMTKIQQLRLVNSSRSLIDQLAQKWVLCEIQLMA